MEQPIPQTPPQSKRRNPLSRQTTDVAADFPRLKLVDFSRQAYNLAEDVPDQPFIKKMNQTAGLLNRDVSVKLPGQQADFAREASRPTTIDLAQTSAGKANPLARIAGSYADDPNWDEFIQAMEASRRELDNITEVA